MTKLREDDGSEQRCWGLVEIEPMLGILGRKVWLQGIECLKH